MNDRMRGYVEPDDPTPGPDGRDLTDVPAADMTPEEYRAWMAAGHPAIGPVMSGPGPDALREAAFYVTSAIDWLEHDDRAAADHALSSLTNDELRAALSGDAESGLDVERLERAFVHVIDRRPTKVEVTYFYGDTIPVEHQRAAFLRDVAAEYERLSR